MGRMSHGAQDNGGGNMIWTPTGWTEYKGTYGLTIGEMVRVLKAAKLPVDPTDWTEAEVRHADDVFTKAERAKLAGRTIEQ